jgi:hypothetical protein
MTTWDDPPPEAELSPELDDESLLDDPHAARTKLPSAAATSAARRRRAGGASSPAVSLSICYLSLMS